MQSFHLVNKIGKKMIEFLQGRKIAILGYGSQGKAQALNLRDSGIEPLIGLPAKSRSAKEAKKNGFHVTTARKAVFLSDVIAVLIPDHKHRELFNSIPASGLSGKTLIFAHGLSVAFGLVRPPVDCDVIMVAPHGPGVRLRERYMTGEFFTAFAGVKQDYSGKAWPIARSYAAAIGCPPANLFESTLEDEAIGDIFGEQAVLCGGLVGLLETGFSTLVKKGHSPESAYLECVYQLDLIIDLIKRYGTAGMFERISKTAAFGSLSVKDKLFDSAFSGKMERLYNEIKSGKFAQKLARENENSLANLKSMLSAVKGSPLQKTQAAVFRRLNARTHRPKAAGR